jgi:glycosyltransferase involved in cell wall biosynthesis
MKIIYVLDAYFPRAVGGTEMYTDALANDVRDMGHEVSIVIPDPDNTSADGYIHNSIRIYTYKEPSRVTRNMILGFEKPEGLANFRRLIEELGPDIVHFQMISGGQGVSLHHLETVKKMGIHTVLTMHLSHYTCLTGNLLQNNKTPCDGVIKERKCSVCYIRNKGISAPIASVAAALSGLAAAVSNKSKRLYDLPFLGVGLHVHKQKEQLEKIGELSDRICVITGWYMDMLIRNGVPKEKLTLVKQGVIGGTGPTHTVAPRNDTKIRLVFIGRITKVKGLLVLLEALKGLDNNLYSLDVYGLIGDNNEYYDECTRIIAANGLSVAFRGAIPHKEILQTLPGYDLLCLPSLFSEMSPLVIQEAFKAGVPVIGSEVAGITEEVKDEVNGYIFPFNNSEKLREVLSGILHRPSIVQELKKNVVSPRSFKKVSEETVMVYQEVINLDKNRQ